MENLPAPITNTLRNSLLESFAPGPASKEDMFEVIIEIKCRDVSVRRFAAYLNFIDKSYGRITPKGILSYSRSQAHELKIAELRSGSLFVILSDYLANTGSITALILVGLLLKYLPGVVKSALSAYRDYEEGKLAKVRRLQIREQMKRDECVNKLNRRQILQLSKLLDAMYGLDIRDVPKAHSFSLQSVIKVEFKVSRTGEAQTNQEEVGEERLERDIIL